MQSDWVGLLNYQPSPNREHFHLCKKFPAVSLLPAWHQTPLKGFMVLWISFARFDSLTITVSETVYSAVSRSFGSVFEIYSCVIKFLCGMCQSFMMRSLPLCGHITICLSICLLMDIWNFSSLGP